MARPTRHPWDMEDLSRYHLDWLNGLMNRHGGQCGGWGHIMGVMAPKLWGMWEVTWEDTWWKEISEGGGRRWDIIGTFQWEADVEGRGTHGRWWVDGEMGKGPQGPEEGRWEDVRGWGRGLKGASLITWSSGEQMARWHDKKGGPTFIKRRKTEDVWIACALLIWAF